MDFHSLRPVCARGWDIGGPRLLDRLIHYRSEIRGLLELFLRIFLIREWGWPQAWAGVILVP